MKLRELLLGGGLAAVLILGIVLTRGLGDGGEPPVDLDVTTADGALLVDDISVEVTAAPRPLRVFDPLRFTFRFARDGETLEVVEPRIDFDMVMDMGPHEYRLVPDEAGGWAADGVVLPQCGSGSRLWFGELTFVADDRPRVAHLRLELDPPRAD